MKRLIFALIGMCLALGSQSAGAATYEAKPLQLKFQKVNPFYVSVFFSFYQTKASMVVLRVTVNTLLPRDTPMSESQDTYFPKARLSLRSGRVFLIENGRTILVAHESGLGAWKVDEAKLNFPKKVDAVRNIVTVTPTLSVP
jgi:hypothetical protein